ncbi:D111/G-patch [Ophiocordyceps camponoti-floridani]|uniref:D111/G-patch n=1 Tax=Ophiocordyceps camponoti-floridani TaxID=2030778 RepID=A0A8H4Q8J1_9HYPO|nr:D111/G-patch [Ophiocordyceps camponoti-floridani]
MRRVRNKRHNYDDDDGDDDDYDIPLHRKKPFGAGLKRRRVEFVPASKTVDDVEAATKASSAADLYASIVLNGHEPEPPSTTNQTCAVCSLPITTSPSQHALSMAHQVSLPHAHPPSALDRSRMGLRTLQSQGWDPDARHGLGLHGEGVRFPLKPEVKLDNRGVGAAPLVRVPVKTEEQRKREAEERRVRVSRLQSELWSRIDVEGYLRGDGRDQEM